MSDAGGMDPTFAAKLDALIAASHGTVRIVSGYRSVDEQQRLWNNAVAKYGSPEAARKWVAPPGHSNHNRGLAADLAGDLQLAHQLAPQFGLVFPMSWEAWHIEPVGARKDASRDAYTQGPPGTENPKDKSLADDPAALMAFLTDAMSQAGTEGSSAEAAGAGTGTTDSLLAGTGSTTVGAGTTMSGGGGGGQAAASAQTGGNVSPAQVYQALLQAGVDPAHAAALTAIAGRESGFNTGAANQNQATGDDSHGLFQINLLNGGWGPTLRSHGIDPASLNTLEGSARAAKVLIDASGGTLRPWGGYKDQPWYYGGVDLNTGVDASGGMVSLQDLQGVR